MTRRDLARETSAPGFHEFLDVHHRRQPVLEREVCEHSWQVSNQGIAGQQDHGPGALPDRRLEGALEVPLERELPGAEASRAVFAPLPRAPSRWAHRRDWADSRIPPRAVRSDRILLKSWSRFPPSCEVIMLMPVMLPPGRARLATSPVSTGSAAMPPITMGIVLVASLGGEARRRTRSEDDAHFHGNQLSRKRR